MVRSPVWIAVAALTGCYTSSQWADVDLNGSLMVAEPVNLSNSPGSSTSLTLVVRRGSGLPVAGASVGVQVDSCTVKPSSQVADASGVASFVVTQCQPGVHSASATLFLSDYAMKLPCTTRLNVYPAATGTGQGVLGETPLFGQVVVRDSGGLGAAYTGTVHFTSSDDAATLPPDHTFGAGERGIALFPGGVVLRTSGPQTVTAIDVASGRALFTQQFEVVLAADLSATVLVLDPLPPVLQAGQVVPVTVTAQNSSGGTVTSYTGTITFVSNDPNAVLPPPYTFTARDLGSKTFVGQLALSTAGSRWVSVNDGAIASRQESAQVRPGAAVALQALAVNRTAAGSAVACTVQTVDAYGNTADFVGTVRVTHTDPKASPIADLLFSMGDHGSKLTGTVLRTAGTQALSIVDLSGALSATSVQIFVINGPPAGFALAAPATTQAGQAISLVAQSVDAYGNQAATSTGALTLISSDPNATLPPSFNFSFSDGGVESLRATLTRSGPQTLTLINSVSSAVLAASTLRVAPGPAVSVQAAMAPTVPVATAEPLQVTFFDAFQNLATHYAGSVTFSSNDPNASLPPPYTFVPGDAGTRAFQVTLPHAGPRTITARDTAMSATASTLVLKVRRLATSSGYACAVFENLGLKCWGNNAIGQLGYGDYSNRGSSSASTGPALPFVALGTGRMPVDVSLAAGGQEGQVYGCVLLDNQTIKCWGNNGYGQLGYGDTTNRGASPNDMGDNLPTVNLGTGRSAVAVATGFQTSCAILDTGDVKCWGYNDKGQLGYGDTSNRGDNPNQMGNNLPVVQLGAARKALSLSIGGLWDARSPSHYVCAILDDHSLMCWGSQGGANGVPRAVSLGAGRTATQVSAGPWGTCAVLDNGTLPCWNGQPGGSSASDANNVVPVDLGTGRTVLQVSSGGYLSAYPTYTMGAACALLDNHTVKCWGNNIDGELGTQDTVNRSAANQLGDALAPISLGTGRTALAVSTGGGGANGQHSGFTCAVLDDQSIKCFGGNYWGNLGTGDGNWYGGSLGTMGDALPPVRAW